MLLSHQIELLENVNDTTQLESVLEMSVVRYPESVQLWKKKVAYMVTTKADIDALKRDLDRAAGAVQPTVSPSKRKTFV